MNENLTYIVVKKTEGTYLRRADLVDQYHLYIGNLTLDEGDIVASDQVIKVLQAELNTEWVNVDAFNPFLPHSLPYRTRYIFLDKRDAASKEIAKPWISLSKQIPDEMQECLFTKFENTERTSVSSPILHGVHVKNGLFRPLHAKATHLFKPTHWMPIPGF
uniref:DUF551 domain-containing protein n=1 Tax=Sphingobacterium sp. (strain 21) TaxID=743722 RepID=F4C1I1_SPHS2